MAGRLHRDLGKEATCWLPESQAAVNPEARVFTRLPEVFREALAHREDLVCIMAAGIVVRTIAPFLQGKDRDPAVVVVDEVGQFAVSLLSGHLGGANDLARRVAGILGGTPVITTATDVRGLPALDVLAPRLGLAIDNLPVLKEIHMALLAGRPVRLVDPDRRLTEPLAEHASCFEVAADLDGTLTTTGPAVYVGWEERDWPPGWLRLRPKVLVAGMGCHRHTPAAEILHFIEAVFRQERLALSSLKALATIDRKKDEPGLREAARVLGIEFLWFTTSELQAIPVPHPSPRVHRHLGVESVSEAAALKAAGPRGVLLVPKRKAANATLAVVLAA